MEGKFLEDDWTFGESGNLADEIDELVVPKGNDDELDDDTSSSPTGEGAFLGESGTLDVSTTTGLSEHEDIETNPFDGLPFSSLYYELLEKRKGLPVWSAKDDFVLAVEESSVILVTGRSGSGKSTQIPQWCARLAKEADFQFGTVLCSQPYALAAESLAIHVAREMDFTSVGNEIGFETPLIHNISDETVLKFCTDDILLREMAEDPFLRSYNYVIVDEFQERKTSTDLLLALLKMVLAARDDLRLIVISLDHEMAKLEEFFEGVPIVDLHFLESALVAEEEEKEKESREATDEDELERKRRQKAKQELAKKLDVVPIKTSTEDYCRAVVNLVSDLHCADPVPGNFLIFMPCAKDVYEVVDLISREVAIRILREDDAREFRISQLHHQLPPGAQQAVYDQETKKLNTDGLLMTSPERRHIIVCDEIAESSFSLENIDVVIDTDHTLVTHFNSRFRTHHDSFRRISACSSHLRMNRCQPGGKYFRFSLSDKSHEIQLPRNAPKITTSELSEAILLMKRILHKLNVPFSHCQLLDPPGPEAYMLALEELDYHGALDENGSLSDLGIVMSEIPLPISQAKVIITSCGEDCTEEIVSIMAMLNSPSCFNLRSRADTYHRFIHKSGDHFTLLNIYTAFIASGSSEMWCARNGLNFRALQAAAKKRNDLVLMMEHLELPVSKPISDEVTMETSVKKALLAGYFMQLARDTDEGGNYHIIRDKHTARVHPDSKINYYPQWIIYNQFHLSENNYLSGVCAVTAEMIAEIVPASYILNLPASESQQTLMATSEKLRLAEMMTQSDTHISDASSQHDNATPSSSTRGHSRNSWTPGDQQPSTSSQQQQQRDDYDDTDVITQAMRDLTYAYNQSSDYLRNSEYLADEAQCVVQ